MTRDALARMLARRPFEPFALLTADGRELEVRQPEQATVGAAADAVLFFHPDHRVEIVDPCLVVSMRTVRPAAAATAAAAATED